MFRVVRTAVLTSEENFAWTSMQEILPAIASTWLAAHQPGRHEVSIINIDGKNLAQIVPHVMTADNLVLTCFNAKIGRLAGLLRARLGLEARFLVYLHNQATLACWPFHVWGLGEVLRTDDVFLSSCAHDARAFTHAFEGARAHVLPFTLPSPVAPVTGAATDSHPDFVFVGRVSVQKNLHGLMAGFQRFLAQQPTFRGKLSIIGGEDDLGSPNMGMQSRGYLNWLKDLAGHQGLLQRIEFTGFLQRPELHRRLAHQNHIFISVSLHSDENFGMAAFRSLCGGQKAVLTCWGGHADFVDTFGAQVFPVNVYGTDSGPWTDPQEVADAMTRAWSAKVRQPAGIPTYYQEAEVARQLLAIATSVTGTGVQLQPTSLALRILKQRALCLVSSKNPCKVFLDYSDPLVRPFFESYGMAPPPDPTLAPPARLELRPWIKIEEDRIVNEDPHRGPGQMVVQNQGPFSLSDSQGRICALQAEEAATLGRNGWAR